MQKDLLKLQDWSKEEIIEVLNLGDQLKYEQKHGIPHKHLEGQTLAMIFNKSSTRTRISFEVGIMQLGGMGLFLSSADLQMGRGEPIQDTARVLSRYVDGIMIRTYEQQEVEDLAKYASIPVVNGLTDDFHPCQVLADLMTIREFKSKLEGVKVAYLGDSNNMANSLMIGCLKVGMDVSIASPKGYMPKEKMVAIAQESAKEGNSTLVITDNIEEAVQGADVVITDVWASMGQEAEAEARKAIFENYQINDQVMGYAKEDAIVMHCLPAHREEEITEKMFEKHANVIFEEAENRLHAQKAILVTLMKK
ncbi:MAG TPA: ornithine carbamoyltransferase [Epulopiscium sp.]|nr:ornithine carbamoyltransferase [Candidatus Epulonipiscium sp.]